MNFKKVHEDLKKLNFTKIGKRKNGIQDYSVSGWAKLSEVTKIHGLHTQKS